MSNIRISTSSYDCLPNSGIGKNQKYLNAATSIPSRFMSEICTNTLWNIYLIVFTKIFIPLNICDPVHKNDTATFYAWINSIFLAINLLILLRIFFALCKRGIAVVRRPLLQVAQRRGRYPLALDTLRRGYLYRWQHTDFLSRLYVRFQHPEQRSFLICCYLCRDNLTVKDI